MPEFTFDEEQHVYTLDGLEIPGATRVLRDLGMARSWKGVPGSTVRRDEGTRVHEICEMDDAEILDEDTVPDDLRPGLDYWRSWKDVTGFTPVLNEQSVYHPEFLVAGKYDVLGTIKDSDGEVEWWLLDWKWSKGLGWEVCLQLSMYREMIYALHGEVTRTLLYDDRGERYWVDTKTYKGKEIHIGAIALRGQKWRDCDEWEPRAAKLAKYAMELWWAPKRLSSALWRDKPQEKQDDVLSL